MRRSHLVILGIILLIGLLLRTYQIVERFDFGHDGDLYSWIVRDILINHHYRLIGQLTSAPGIFIGPLFYYLLAPFFILTKMDPIGALIPITVVGLLTIFSYYFVLSKLFTREVGLIGAFLHAILISTVSSDRWVVPTVTTPLWGVWYLYTILNIARGNFSVLPILGVLIGLIWHIHIALVPTLVAVPIALYFAKKLPQKREIIIFLTVTFLSLLPLLIFESRHSFLQTKSLITNLTASFSVDESTSEDREVVLNARNDNARLNLNPASKFLFEVEPQTPKIGDQISLKITTKNSKYSTLTIFTDCGDPKMYEIGALIAEFKWSTTGCAGSSHKIIATARVPMDPLWKIVLDKSLNVFEKENRNINNLFAFPLDLPQQIQHIITAFILISPLLVWKIKAFTKSQILICYGWIISVFLFFSFSSIVVSEYYLASIDVIFIVSISLILHKICRRRSLGRYLVLSLLLLILVKNIYYYISYKDYKKGYVERKAAAQFIVDDARQKDFPCIGVSYITQSGENVGFRYFFYLKKQHLVHPFLEVPIYNIVIPDELSEWEINKRFGHIGVIIPKNILPKDVIDKSCQTPDTNLTDPMFGFTE